jgi:hypothetical protein
MPVILSPNEVKRGTSATAHAPAGKTRVRIRSGTSAPGNSTVPSTPLPTKPAGEHQQHTLLEGASMSETCR